MLALTRIGQPCDTGSQSKEVETVGDKPPGLAIVTSASSEVGLGHASRQFVLAHRATQRGLDPFIVSDSDWVGSECERLSLVHEQVPDIRVATDVRNVLARVAPARIVIDVHERDVMALQSLASLAPLSLVLSQVGYRIDFFGETVVLLGHDLDTWDRVRTERKSDGQVTQVRSGRAYLMFRDEFFAPSQVVREADRLLIAHGGSDECGLTQRSLHALQHTSGKYRCDVLMGSANRGRADIEDAIAVSKHACELIHDAATPSKFMRRATVAVMSGGNIRYELCVTGTPFVAVSFNSTQYACTQQLADLGIGVNLGVAAQVSDEEIARAVDRLMENVEKRAQMRSAMVGAFDHRGAERILDAIFDHRSAEFYA